MKHTTDKCHNNDIHNSILAKGQQTKGKMGKNTNFGNTQWKETILCANKCLHVRNIRYQNEPFADTSNKS